MLLVFCLFSRCFIVCVMVKGCLHLKFRYICMSVIYIPVESGVLLLVVVVLGYGVGGIMAVGTPALFTAIELSSFIEISKTAIFPLMLSISARMISGSLYPSLTTMS
ncbi:hypothetical protein Hanom_Chr07g00598771 [Helianthus anomalus]